MALLGQTRHAASAEDGLLHDEARGRSVFDVLGVLEDRLGGHHGDVCGRDRDGARGEERAGGARVFVDYVCPGGEVFCGLFKLGGLGSAVVEWGEWGRSGEWGVEEGDVHTRSTLNMSISPNRSRVRRMARDSEMFRGDGAKCNCSCVNA